MSDVGIAELKARLSEHLRSVRNGGTLTVLIWRDRMGPLPAMATHDAALGVAARAFGFDVRGLG
ncbi:MAG: hypothetical protein FJW14_01220 [Acidimicrobiia bacterium]|nr:hypothetical protein [Acidimicrobiia bacterium]